MKVPIGRNDPCPCGSGRKFKHCCLGRTPVRADTAPQGARQVAGLAGEGSGRFRFQAGSYGGRGGYFPSIVCLKREATGEWTYHFVLVIPEDVREDEDSASLAAGDHLFAVFQGGSSPGTLASALRKMGYVKVSDFNIVDDDSSHKRGFAAAMDSGE